MPDAVHVIDSRCSCSYRVLGLNKPGLGLCGCGQLRNSWQESCHRRNTGISVSWCARVRYQPWCSMGSGAGEWRYWSNQEFCCELHRRADLGCRCELCMRCPKIWAVAAHVLLGSLGCGTAEWETQAGLVSKCIVSSYIWDNVLGLWWWPQKSVG